MLAKTAGVKHLVVLINKMDDHTVGWSEDRYAVAMHAYMLDTHAGFSVNLFDCLCTCTCMFRYEECKTKLTPFLKKVGFNPKTGQASKPLLAHVLC